MTYVAAGSAALQVVGGVENGAQIEKQGEIMQQIANQNAAALVQDSWRAEDYGDSQSAAYQKEITDTIATQRANMAAKDVDVTFGSAQAVQQDSQLAGYLNQLDIQQAGRQKAAGLLKESSNTGLQGAMEMANANFQASNTEAQGINGALNTLGNRYKDSTKYERK